MYQVKSPVLFLIFNRPEETQAVFNAIRAARPLKLYIAADGPRNSKHNDIALCKQTRDIVKNVDWDCNVKTLFREENYGCKMAVSSNITWFFENEEEGIVLEDDCLPNEQFFEYCDILLEKYRYDTRIRHISGTNLNVGGKITEETYYYSKLTQVWGWASWRRVWKDYDVDMNFLDDIKETSFFNNIFFNDSVSKFLYKQFKQTKQGHINTWDFQYLFCNLINNGLSINSNFNLVSNIGFSKNATHTIDKDNKFANMPWDNFNTIIHPNIMIPNIASDVAQLKRDIPPLFERGKNSLKSILKKILETFQSLKQSY